MVFVKTYLKERPPSFVDTYVSMKKDFLLLLAPLVIVGLFLALVFGYRREKPDNTVMPPPDTTADLIRVFEPEPNDEIRSPLTVRGEARGTWYFEASFGVRLVDNQDKEIAAVPAQALGEWMTTDFVPFEATLSSFYWGSARSGILILEKANPSGLPEQAMSLRIPVRFPEVAPLALKVFFSNNKKDPQMLDCAKVFPVERTVAQTVAVGRAALQELLKGPSAAEQNEGYTTSINQGVVIERLTIENGIASVDFDDLLEAGVGGSCRVTAIVSQIKQTLLQFPTVKKVLISVNGRTEDILQP